MHSPPHHGLAANDSAILLHSLLSTGSIHGETVEPMWADFILPPRTIRDDMQVGEHRVHEFLLVTDSSFTLLPLASLPPRRIIRRMRELRLYALQFK